MIIIEVIRNILRFLSCARCVDNAISALPTAIMTDPSKGSSAPAIKEIIPMM